MDHHAYFLIGTSTWARSVIEEGGRVPSADMLWKEYESFGVDDARELTHESSLAPVSHTHRVFVIQCRSLTQVAQNALLKLFEDPTPTARFYLVVPSESVLIPTLRSRLQLFRTEEQGVTEKQAGEEFLNASYAERLELVLKYVEREDDSWVTPLLDALEARLYSKGNVDEMRELLFVRTYIRRQGASKKMLLEHLALSLS